MKKILYYFGVWLAAVMAVTEKEKQMYNEINLFRNDPLGYSRTNNVHVACTLPLTDRYSRLKISPELERSSVFQARTLASFECGQINHQTCPAYCYMFGGDCSHIARMESFLAPKKGREMSEILVMGPKNATKIMGYFLGSTGHCNHILSPKINSMGASFQHVDRNVFVVDLCFIEPSHQQGT